MFNIRIAELDINLDFINAYFIRAYYSVWPYILHEIHPFKKVCHEIVLQGYEIMNNS